MGLECTKAVPEGRGPVQDSFQSYRRVLQIGNSKEVVTFFIKIDNLRFLDFSHTFHKIRILVQGHFSRQIFSKEFTKQDKIWICSSQLTAQLKAPISQISNKVVSIQILDREGNIIDELKLKLYHLSVGPVKHDHLLKSLHSRLLFDFYVDQFMNVEISLNDFQIVWKNPQRYAKYSYFLSLIFSNTRNHIQATKKYEKHEKIKGWGLEKIQIKNSELSDSVIRLKMANTDNGDHNIECFIPYSKFAQQTAYRQISNQDGSFETRQLTMNEDIIISGESVGSIRLIMGLTKSKLFAQQMDCVIYSQKGIVMTTESDFHELPELNGKIILSFLTKLRNGKQMGMSDHQFFKLMVQINQNIQDKEIHITDDLFKVQELVLDFMLELSDLIEQDRVIRNEYIWKILHSFLHKKIMNLRYFGSIQNQSSKKKYSLKFYRLLIGNLIRIIEFINNGISFKEVTYIQRFVAYAFFRLPWCQAIIVGALSKSTDPVISEEKLGEIGASLSMKSPSRSFFYDYENTALKLVQREEQFIKLMSLLQKTHHDNQRWASLLFDREYQQLFYGLYTELWDEAQFFLNNNGRVMWQYFPKYGALLSIFLGQMNSNGIIDFSVQMTRCNMKLIMNEKLLNTFMMLIFPKTCLYETYCVLKCLDLINCYFLVILENNKKIPADFNYNYFYTGIRCILESNHSYLLQRMLAIIYKYYNIFSKDFRDTLNHYINCKVFNQLFMHWSQNVRNIFHLLLIFRISKFEASQNPEGCYKNIKSNNQHHDEKLNFETIIENLNYLKAEHIQTKTLKPKKKMEYFETMKLKLKKKMLLSESFESEKELTSQQCDKKLSQFHTPVIVRRKWSLAVSFEEQRPLPSVQEMKYLSMSLKQFEMAKAQKNPDAIVESRSKVLQVNIDQ